MVSASHSGRALRSTFRAVLALSAFALLTPVAKAQSPVVMKLSTPTLNDVQHQFLIRYKAELEKRSGGRIKADIYPASQLGPIPRQIEAVQLGAVQVFVCPPEFLDGVDPRFSVPSAVGIFKDIPNMDKSLKDPEFRKAYFPVGANRGIKIGAMFLSGPIGINSRDPIRHIADVKGKKLRVLASPLQMEPIIAMGGSPVPMALSAVLPALQQGAIDGVLSVLPVLSAFRYYDAAKYFTNTDFSMITSQASISKVWFDKQPKDLQTIIEEAALAASSDLYPWAMEFHAREKKKWVDNKGEIIDLPKAERDAELVKLVVLTDKLIKEKPALEPLYKTMKTVAARH
jgi:TRAP-type C4-dicarboxylate transport system substrate-binding protein